MELSTYIRLECDPRYSLDLVNEIEWSGIDYYPNDEDNICLKPCIAGRLLRDASANQVFNRLLYVPMFIVDDRCQELWKPLIKFSIGGNDIEIIDRVSDHIWYSITKRLVYTGTMHLNQIVDKEICGKGIINKVTSTLEFKPTMTLESRIIGEYISGNKTLANSLRGYRVEDSFRKIYNRYDGR